MTVRRLCSRCAQLRDEYLQLLTLDDTNGRTESLVAVVVEHEHHLRYVNSLSPDLRADLFMGQRHVLAFLPNHQTLEEECHQTP